MGESARVRLIRAAQSDELREAFRQLAEMEGPEGPRFPRRVLMDLAARVVGRAYDPMLLELCHLLRAAFLAGGRSAKRRGTVRRGGGVGFEWLFWGVAQARAGAFRAAFSAPAHPGSSRPPFSCEDSGPALRGDGIVASDEAVTLIYPDGRFEVRYGRMASLAAMTDFLVSTLGYRVLVDVSDSLAAPALRLRAVSRAAGDLARRLYAWLDDHLPTAQAQRKFRAMTGFLEEVRGPDFTDDDIDDEAVLRFWLRHAGARGDNGGSVKKVSADHGDFRGFRTTLLAFLALLRVLERGEEIGRFERYLPIGSDREAGEIDPAAEWQAVDTGQEEEDPLSRLQEEPSAAIKVLNRRELALLALPMRESAGVRRLPRSYLRAECFGPIQNRLSQALRRRAGVEELAVMAGTGPDPAYRGHIELLERVAAHLSRAARACLYVLHRARAGRESDDDGTPTTLDFRLMGEARRAFEGLNRAGFERSAPSDPHLVSAHAALAERLPGVVERLGAVLEIFAAPERWTEAEAEDRPVFAGAFTRLYATARDGAGAGSSASLGGPLESKREGCASRDSDEGTEEAPISTGEDP